MSSVTSLGANLLRIRIECQITHYFFLFIVIYIMVSAIVSATLFHAD